MTVKFKYYYVYIVYKALQNCGEVLQKLRVATTKIAGKSYKIAGKSYMTKPQNLVFIRV